MSGVYISYPFCAQKCSFCNFASGVQPPELESRYTDALLREISGPPVAVDARHGLHRRRNSEPTAGSGDLRRILDHLPGRTWREGTIEAAPGSLSPDLARSGVTPGWTG